MASRPPKTHCKINSWLPQSSKTQCKINIWSLCLRKHYVKSSFGFSIFCLSVCLQACVGLSVCLSFCLWPLCFANSLRPVPSVSDSLPSERVLPFPNGAASFSFSFICDAVCVFYFTKFVAVSGVCLEKPRERGLHGRSPCSPREREAPTSTLHLTSRFFFASGLEPRSQRSTYRAGH